MSSLAVALAAVAAAAVQAAQPAAPATYKPTATAHHDACGPQIDPQFARYVPPAPSADGKNPLLRLISSPDESFAVETFRSRTAGACFRALRRVDFAH
jgi:hypothetical protein